MGVNRELWDTHRTVGKTQNFESKRTMERNYNLGKHLEVWERTEFWESRTDILISELKDKEKIPRNKFTRKLRSEH